MVCCHDASTSDFGMLSSSIVRNQFSYSSEVSKNEIGSKCARIRTERLSNWRILSK